jgi:hypothetical protein
VSCFASTRSKRGGLGASGLGGVEHGAGCSHASRDPLLTPNQSKLPGAPGPRTLGQEAMDGSALGSSADGGSDGHDVGR